MPDFKSIEFDNTFNVILPQMQDNSDPVWKIANKLVSVSERLVHRTSKHPNLRADVMEHIVSAFHRCDFDHLTKFELYRRSVCGDLGNLDVVLCTLKNLTPRDVQHIVQLFNDPDDEIVADVGGLCDIMLEDHSSHMLDLIGTHPYIWDMMATALKTGHRINADTDPQRLAQLCSKHPTAGDDLLVAASHWVRLFAKQVQQIERYNDREVAHEVLAIGLSKLDQTLALLSSVATPDHWAAWSSTLQDNCPSLASSMLVEHMPHLTAHAQSHLLHALMPTAATRRTGSKL